MVRQTARASRLPLSNPLVLSSPALARIPWLVHGFSTRLGGLSRTPGTSQTQDLNLAFVPWDDPSTVQANRKRFLEALGAGSMRPVVQEQIHSDLIRLLRAEPPRKRNLRGDGLLTRRRGLLLSILAADCVPVLLVDVRKRAVAALHCGWRGALRRIAEKAVGDMRAQFGSRTEDIHAAIGPGIGRCCYEVGEEVAAEFESQFLYAREILDIRQRRQSNVEVKYAVVFRSPFRPLPPLSPRSIYLDLAEASRRQLSDGGVAAEHIHAEASLCTRCRADLFFSHRRDGATAGRMMAVIGLRE